MVQVAAGPEHCVALTANGDVFTWGRGQYYVLGHGSETPLAQPQMVHSLNDVRVTKVAAGENHSLALDDKGQLWSWGKLATGHPDANGRGMPARVQGLDGVQIVDMAAGSRWVSS